MLKINIICIGKIKEKYIEEGIKEFLKRLTRFANVSIIELKDENDTNTSLAIQKETNLLINEINKNSGYVILLDLKGKNISSEELSEKISDISMNYSIINFVIGGSNGYSDNLREISNFRLSFSKMTFPHQLMRLILMEQVYRAMSIINNIKYHK